MDYGKRYFEERYGRFKDDRFMGFFGKLSSIKFPVEDKGNALVIGSGFGGDMAHSPQWRGVDISPYAVKFSRERGMDVIQCDAEKLRFKNKEFEAVIISHLLEHVASPEKVLKEAHRVLKENGEIFLALPELNANQGNREDAHLYQWSPEVLQNLLERAGFEVISIKHFNYRAKFVACKFPFWFGRIISSAAGIFISGGEEFVVRAKKSDNPALVQEIYDELLEFHDRLGIEIQKRDRLKETLVREFYQIEPLPKTKNPTIAVYCFSHATEKLIPVIRELLMQRYNVFVLAHDYRARKMLFENSISALTLEDYGNFDEGADLKSRIWQRLKQAEKFFEKEKPALLLTNIDSFLEGKVLVKVANKKGIPTLLYQHGLKPLEDLPIASKYVAVWGSAFKKQLLKAGIPKKRIFVTGFVGTDEIFNYKRNPQGIVSYFTQGHAFDEKTKEKMLKAAMKYAASKKLKLVIKPHPAEHKNLYKSKNLVVFPKSYSVYKLLSESDETMTLSSTTSLEAAIMGIRCISVKNLRPIRYDLDETIYKCDRKTAKRMVELIGSLIGGGKSEVRKIERAS